MSHREGQMLTDSLDRFESALLTNQDLYFSSWVHGGGPARRPCRFHHRSELSLQLANLHRRTSGLQPGSVGPGRRVPAFPSLGAAWRNQSNHPEQNDRPDESGEEADEEASADDSENHGEEPAAQERADDPHDQVSEQTVPMTAHHAPGQRTRDQPDKDEQDEVHGSLLRRMFTPMRYSITWSARPSTDGGIVSPSAFAVLMLMTSSNLVGCSTGRSAGFAPFRILST